MQVCSNFKRLCSRLGSLANGSQRKKQAGRQLTISAPFNFKKEATMLPGYTEDDICALREEAAASRLGVAGHDHGHGHGNGRDRPRQSGGSPSSSSDSAARIASPASCYSPRAPPLIPVRAPGHSLAAALMASSSASKPSISPTSPLETSLGIRSPGSPTSAPGQGRPF